jgi:hypothetical protein
MNTDGFDRRAKVYLSRVLKLSGLTRGDLDDEEFDEIEGDCYAEFDPEYTATKLLAARGRTEPYEE